MTLPLDDDGLVERLRAGGDGEGWALLKRGLYWRPNGQGYTGRKSEAGIYSDQQASAYVEHDDSDGTTKVRWVDAPDLSPSCSTETALLYYIIRALTAERALIQAEARGAERMKERAADHIAARAEELRATGGAVGTAFGRIYDDEATAIRNLEAKDAG